MGIRRRSVRLGVIAVLLSGLAWSAVAQAQIPEGVEGAFEPHPEAEEAISRLFSPFCPGFMLEVCTASQSYALRDSMQALAYQGWTSDELVEWMLANHGEEYLAVPEASGWGLWAWILPPLALLAGLGMVLYALKRFKPVEAATRDPKPDDKVSVISAAEEERLRSAIREIEISEDPSF